MQHHKYSLTELDNMMPYEREIYMGLLTKYIKVGNVADDLDDAPVAKPKVDTKPQATKVETPVVEEDDTLAYFEKLAE